MATTSRPASINRPPSATGAAVTLVLSAVADFANLGGYLTGAPIPPVFVGVWIALGVGALLAAGGLGAGRRWGAPLAIGVAAVTVLLGAMGFFASSSTTGKAVAAACVILGLVVIALSAPHAARRTVA